MGVNAEPFTPRTLEWETAERAFKATLLSNYVHELQKDVTDLMVRIQEIAIGAHKKASRIVTPHFVVGDFVLISKVKRPTQKLAFIRGGPQNVILIESTAVCVVKRLTSQQKET